MAGLSDVNAEVVNLVEKGALAGISGAILMQKPDLLNAVRILPCSRPNLLMKGLAHC